MRGTLEQRLRSRQQRDTATGCLLFTGARNAAGYGVIGRGGRDAGLVKAHRASAFFAGIIPSLDDPRLVCHTCDNPPCTEPAHLYAGDKMTNALDAVANGLWGDRSHTHCVKGHVLDESNSYIAPDGRRRCRRCRTLAVYKSRERRRDAA